MVCTFLSVDEHFSFCRRANLFILIVSSNIKFAFFPLSTIPHIMIYFKLCTLFDYLPYLDSSFKVSCFETITENLTAKLQKILFAKVVSHLLSVYWICFPNHNLCKIDKPQEKKIIYEKWVHKLTYALQFYSSVALFFVTPFADLTIILKLYGLICKRHYCSVPKVKLMSWNWEFTSIHLLNADRMLDNTRSSVCISHIECSNQMSCGDVIVAPSIEG